MNPEPCATLEQIDETERREIIAVSAAGVTQIFANPHGGPVDVVEIIIHPVVANTITVMVNNQNYSPSWDLGIRQTMVDPGFILPANGDRVQLHLGAAGSVQVLLRWRIRKHCG